MPTDLGQEVSWDPLSVGVPPMSEVTRVLSAIEGGDPHAAEQLLPLVYQELRQLAAQRYVAPYFFAGIYAGLGEDDRALEYLEQSYQEHSHWLIYLHIDPSMDRLRANPRFQGLLQRIGLPLGSDVSS